MSFSCYISYLSIHPSLYIYRLTKLLTHSVTRRKKFLLDAFQIWVAAKRQKDEFRENLILFKQSQRINRLKNSIKIWREHIIYQLKLKENESLVTRSNENDLKTEAWQTWRAALLENQVADTFQVYIYTLFLSSSNTLLSHGYYMSSV